MRKRTNHLLMAIANIPALAEKLKFGEKKRIQPKLVSDVRNYCVITRFLCDTLKGIFDILGVQKLTELGFQVYRVCCSGEKNDELIKDLYGHKFFEEFVLIKQELSSKKGPEEENAQYLKLGAVVIGEVLRTCRYGRQSVYFETIANDNIASKLKRVSSYVEDQILAVSLSRKNKFQNASIQVRFRLLPESQNSPESENSPESQNFPE